MTRIAKTHPTHTPLAAPTIGLVQWFQPGEHARVETVLAEVKELGVTELRTGISWAAYTTQEGKAWYNWLIPTLAKQVQVLPCFQDTPASLAVAPKTSAPPQNPTAFAEFLDSVLTDLGTHFEWVELWNEPNNKAEYDFTLDQNWNTFSQMIAVAAQVVKQHGKKTVLGGMSPIDPNWLQLMYNRGVLENMDAIGIHGFPDVFDQNWEGWDANIQRVREVLDRNSVKAEIWITEAGFSTWQHDEFKQFQEFRNVCKAPVNKVYWSSVQDLDMNSTEEFHADERKNHFGLKHVDGCPKLLYRLWAENGLDGLDKFNFIRRKEDFSDQERYSVVTGGAGFVGTNLAKRLLEQGKRVLIFDNLSRTGVERNLQWLHQNYGDKLEVYVGDIRDLQAVKRVMKYANEVYHFAAQVAVTTSLTGPIQDFEINARGVVNVLEAIRAQDNPPPLVFTSTNKVYGGLEDLRFIQNGTRYNPSDKHIKANGISEARPLDFHSPYGCSKGAADQYVVDYARTYGIPAVVFRMSCIYGPHQYGNEDQGWVAHFAIRAIENKAISIYGDGKQVRDILFVEDLVDAFLLAQENMKDLSGQAFNIGGGVKNTTSLLELLDLIGNYRGKKVNLSFGDWRPGDQHYYVSDIRKFHEATGWYPKNSVAEGVAKLYQWLCETRGIEVSLKAPVALEQETDNVAVA
ncbi:SDR family NAD(P)-dependent oxidoreductase [Rufibacter latericius]|uniref:SDR family NAD(P)-dependent oxidoreductase n=1 Tax=Rufibacter latericius TaxID=2487040 RepID=A0A3M9N1Q7_9BACT|nr:SDR family NAD(P)-dependent oxidoreductase [Rufibacter latericius]RNI31325.1 SDR family NAD(P)-dependent oxidoreductase [Rufibacter latericius]